SQSSTRRSHNAIRGHCLCAPLAPAGTGPALAAVSLRIRRRFTQAFLQNDIDKLRGVRYQPQGLTQLDQHLIEYFRWVAQLPRSEYEDAPQKLALSNGHPPVRV